MTASDIRATVLQVLAEVVPGTDPAAIESGVNFRDQLDMDSMDFLNLVIALHERLGVDIPEIDYPKLSSLDGCVTYLSARLAG
jgi:acyl carrier protein